MKIGMIINTSKKNAIGIAKKAIDVLKKAGVEVILCAHYNELEDNCTVLSDDELYNQANIIVVVGGDGTIIHSAKRAALLNKPVLGINAGRFGYLAGLEEDELEAIANLVTSKYTTETRMMLSVEIDGKETYYALNDAVITKGGVSRMIDIKASVQNQELIYRADGLITATPTGSTAYSLSAGGPVIDPRLESIILTPISPQSLFARPIIINAAEAVTISADAPDDTSVYLTIDGEEAFKILPNSVVKIKKAENLSVKLIKINKDLFLNAMAEKFSLLK